MRLAVSRIVIIGTTTLATLFGFRVYRSNLMATRDESIGDHRHHPCSDGDTHDLPRPIHVNGRYCIPWEGFKRPGAWGLVQYLTTEKDHSAIPSVEELDKVFPVTPLDKSAVGKPVTDGLRVTWMGHATVLVQMDGINILTDPMFSARCGPIPAPKRYRNPPCQIDELPVIHAVVISHNHYDHLDYWSVVQLNQRFGEKLRWFVPSNLKDWMVKSGCQNVTELTWWETAPAKFNDSISFQFVCVPAQHWSKRSLNDDDKTLWGGWCILGPKHRFYYSGDTGYNDNVFKLIGKEYGPFDLAAIPIGAYLPRWFMKCQHVDPDEAFQVHRDVQAFNSIGIHWGTFKLSSEFYLEPRIRIKELQDKEVKEVDREGFFTVNPGISRQLKGWPQKTTARTVHSSSDTGLNVDLV